jgi:hypothetical protein
MKLTKRVIKSTFRPTKLVEKYAPAARVQTICYAATYSRREWKFYYDM